MKRIFAYCTKGNRLLIFTLSFLVLFSVGVSVFASALYSPGDTNDPACAPGDAGCYVDPYPSQTGHANQVLTTDGANVGWVAAGSGTVTSVSAGSGLTGGAITGSGTIALDLSSANIWTGQQTFNSSAPIFGTLTTNGGIFYGNGTGQLQETASGLSHQVLHGGTTPAFSAIDLASDVSGTLPFTSGGTGLTASGTSNQILGMNSAGTSLEYKTLGGDATLSGSTITISNNAIATGKISNNAVTYAKMQNTGTPGVLLGSASTGVAIGEITVGSGLTLSGSTLSASATSTTIGTIDTAPGGKSADGLKISSGVLYAQNADGTYPGLVSVGTQTFAGAKTFSGSLTASGGLNAGGNVVSGVSSPSISTDAANKAYVDNLVSGVKWKTLAQAATASSLPAYTYNNGTAGVGATLTANVNAVLTIDGTYTPSLNDRILVKDEASGQYNGIYTLTTVGTVSVPWVLTRVTDSDEGTELVNAAIAIANNGASNANKAFIQTTPATITVGTTPLVWANFISTAYLAGNGLSLTGNVFNVNLSTIAGTLGLANGGTGISGGGSVDQILSMNGSGALVYKTLTGDVALSGSTLTIQPGVISSGKIATGAVTYSKLQNETQATLLGNPTGSSLIPPQEITLGTGLSFSGNTLNATGGSGTVTSVTAGSGLSGGSITTTGTLTLDLAHSNSWTGQQTFNSSAPIFGTLTTNGGIFYGNGTGQLLQTSSGTSHQVLHGGTAPSFSAVDLTADITGALAISNGGTGQTTKAAAFNALSPIQNAGDLIIGNGTNSATNLAIGGSGQCLTVVSGAPAWGTCSTGAGVNTLSVIGGSSNASGASISGTTLTLQPADATHGGVVISGGTQTFSGQKIFNSDIGIHTSATVITVGFGNNSVVTNTVVGSTAGQSMTALSSANTYIGYQSGQASLGASDNTAVGNQAGYNMTSGSNNTWFGSGAGFNTTTGTSNLGIGLNAGAGISTGTYNVAVGVSAMAAGTLTGLENIAVGPSAGSHLSSGNYNTLIGSSLTALTTGSSNIILSTNDGSGHYGGSALTTGSNNVFIGAWNGMSATATSTVAVSDGAGNLRLYVNGAGNTNIGGNTSPTSLFSVGSSSQFQVNSSGAVAAATGITSSGTITLSGLISCGGLQTNGAGVVSCTSDQNYKDIHSDFTAGLSAILQIHPKTYSWKQGTYLYDGGVNYSGFIAQDVQAAVPQGVSIGSQGQLQLNTTTVLATAINAIKDLDGLITPLQSIDPNVNGSLASLVAQFFETTAIHIRDLTVDKLHIGSSDKPTGITLYDTVTKQPYCLTITNGQPTSTAGECGTVDLSQPASPPATVTPPSDSVVPTATSTETDTATSTATDTTTGTSVTADGEATTAPAADPSSNAVSAPDGTTAPTDTSDSAS